MTSKRFMIYGATGFTGKLMAELCKSQGLNPILAARNLAKLLPVAKPLGFETRTAALDDSGKLRDLLNGVDAVIHCAGPFSATATPMLDACLATGTHYLDITGEIDVFERHAARDAEARSAGIVVMSGAGFDVVPTDCLAAHLKDRLPDAIHLKISIGGLSKISAGTAKTAAERIGRGTAVRREGRIIELKHPVYGSTDFGQGPVPTLAMSWGDIATAYHTTGIPNITVYFQATPQIEKLSQLGGFTRWLLSRKFVQRRIKARIEKTIDGPNAQERETAKAVIVAEASNEAGRAVSAQLTTPEGYTFTCYAALEIVRRILTAAPTPGFHTPAGALGPDLVTDLHGVTRIDLD